MNIANLKTTFSVIALSAVLTACGGGGGSDTSSGNSNAISPTSSTSPAPQSVIEPQATVKTVQKLTGVLTDSPIANISYTTTSGLSGKTNENGQFSYAKGDSVTFHLGNLVFPSISARAIVTPLEIFGTTDINNPQVINALRLFQSLDDDGQIEQTITLTDAAVQAVEKADLRLEDFYLTTVEFEALPAISQILASDGINAKSLISRSSALSHFTQYVINAENLDSDNDGLTNAEDSDDDNDGIPDLTDAAPLERIAPDAEEVYSEEGYSNETLGEEISPVEIVNTDTTEEPAAAEPVMHIILVPSNPSRGVVTNTSEPTPVVSTPTPTTEETETDTPVVADEVIGQQEETVADPIEVVEESPIVEETPIVEVAYFDALINWSAPVARENGDPLQNDDISGFEIKYRNTLDGSYTSITVNEPTATSYTISNLPSGEYEVLIATIDSEGIYSDFSSPVTYAL